MATRKPKADDAPPDDGTPPDDGPDQVTVDRNELVDIVKEVVADLIPGTPPATPPADDEPKAKAGRRSLRDEEDDMEARVAKEVERIRAEEARDSRLKAVEEKVTEKPPGQPRKLTRFFGWDREPEKAKR